MADTLTPNYSWVKPEISGSPTTWGNKLNSDLDLIDAQVKTNANAATANAAPIGSISLFAGATPPTGWLICDGSSRATTGTYAALFAICGYAFGGSGANFNLPNLQQRFPVGIGGSYTRGLTGGEATHLLAAGEMPAHAHAITDVAHNHTITQTAHSHPDPGHTHGVNDPTHAHSIPGSFGFGIGGTAPPSPLVNQCGSATGATGAGISIQVAATGLQPANATISLAASGTGLSTTQNTGGGAAHENRPPYIAINFIIRYQ